MTTYNTKNGLGSSAVKDLYDNAQNTDHLANDRQLRTYPDRLGVPRQTWYGMEMDHDEQMTSQETRFQSFLNSSGYVFLGDYEDGPFQFSARNQYVRYDNQYYRLNAATDVGFTTTGTSAETFATDVTHLVLMDGDTLRQNLGSSETGLGASLVALSQGGTIQNVLERVFSPLAFGALLVGSIDAAHTNSKSFQNALNAIYTIGGGVLRVPPATYYLDAPIFPFSNTTLDITGSILIFKNPCSAIGRGGIIVGSSQECNRETAVTAYANNSHPASIVNEDFINPTIGQYLENNQNFVQSENVHIIGGMLKAYFDGSTANWGGYGINFANAQKCTVRGTIFEGWTEAINMGSDISPETPSCYACFAYDITVIAADLVRTYYAIGFIANSTKCGIINAKLLTPLTDGTSNGSGVATNSVEDCIIFNIDIPKLGNTVSSEGVLLNNAKGCFVDAINVGYATSALSTFYSVSSYNDPAKPNYIGFVNANYCTQALAITAKYAVFAGMRAIGVTQEVLFRNINATSNTIKTEPASMAVGSSSTNAIYWYLINNTVRGWKRNYIRLRPIDLFKGPFTDLYSWDLNKSLKMNSGTSIYFHWQVPENIKAIDSIKFFGNFSVGAAAAGIAVPANDTTVTAQLRYMSAEDGNASTAAVVPLNAEKVIKASENGDGDFSCTFDLHAEANGYLPVKDSAYGLDNSMDMLITWVNKVNSNTMKEITIRYWGD